MSIYDLSSSREAMHRILCAALAFYMVDEESLHITWEFIEDMSNFQFIVTQDFNRRAYVIKKAFKSDSAKLGVSSDNKVDEILFQLRALLADGTELRIPRKNFFKAIQEDVQLEVLTEHDEDFVVIRRK